MRLSDGSGEQRFRATVEYDGTDYCGFQRQIPAQPTVQSELERALSHIAQGDVTIVAAGRTDSGVHALGQVISFDLQWRHGTDALCRAVNANLPADIALLSVDKAVADFHPRYDAQRRTYRYYVYNRPRRSPLRRLYSWHVPQSLNLDAMNRAAQGLIGVHDFATFGQPTQGDSTTRQLFKAKWQPQDSFIVFEVAANAFLYRMVRSIVGSLKVVGSGEWTVEEFMEAFGARDRSRAAATAPPEGLFLVSVAYDE